MINIIITKYLLIYNLEKDRNLLINTLSGAVDIVSDEVKTNLENNIIPKDKSVVNKLLQRKYILMDEKEEEDIFNSFKNYEGYIKYGVGDKRTIGFAICPTYNCNLRCIYCFENHLLHESNEVMTIEQVDEAFRMMEEKILPYANADAYVIQLFGGEPLQRITKDIVKYIINKSKKNNIQISIVTNGVNIKDFMDLFEENKDRLLFQITLDGIKEIHDKRRIQSNGKGTFDLIVENINLLLKNGYDVKVRVNTSIDTVEYIPNLINLFDENNWCKEEKFKCILAPVSERNSMPTCVTTDEFEIFEKIYRLYPNIGELRNKYRISLGADMYRIVGHLNRILKPNIVPKHSLPSIAYCEASLLKMFFFGPEGLVYPCAETLGQKQFSIASYYPNKEIFQNNINQWKDRTILNMEECKKCSIATLCGGGCAYAALKFKGSAKLAFCGNSKRTIDKYVTNYIK